MNTVMKLDGVMRTIGASVQVPGQPEHKFTLNMDFSNCTVDDVIVLAMSPRRISWANASRAKGEDYLKKLDAIQTIIVQPVGTRGPIDVEAAFMAKAASFSDEKLDAEIKRLESLRAAKKANK